MITFLLPTPANDDGGATFEQNLLLPQPPICWWRNAAAATSRQLATDHVVTIIIAAHNEGTNLRRTVDSILENTDGPEFEIILIDDGSIDASFAFLDQQPYRVDHRLRRYRFDQSVGCIKARHKGALLAQGKVLAFLDAHMSVSPGWLELLMRSMASHSESAAITPDISPLVLSSWTAEPSRKQIAGIDEKLDFLWLPAANIDAATPISTVLGCCTLISRDLYWQSGGFDLGLRRWGCEFIDLILKVYAVGGACYHEPGVLVGHLFRDSFPYSMSYRDLNYNKLRTCYLHFPESSFHRLADNLSTVPEIAEAMQDFRESQPELGRMRHMQRTTNTRGPEWFVQKFMPGLNG